MLIDLDGLCLPIIICTNYIDVKYKNLWFSFLQFVSRVFLRRHLPKLKSADTHYEQLRKVANAINTTEFQLHPFTETVSNGPSISFHHRISVDRRVCSAIQYISNPEQRKEWRVLKLAPASAKSSDFTLVTECRRKRPEQPQLSVMTNSNRGGTSKNIAMRFSRTMHPAVIHKEINFARKLLVW